MHCEYMNNPLGIDINSPRFSWVIKSTERGVSQSAYRLLAADNRKKLDEGIGNIWDSGIRQSDQSVNIAYEGKPLQSSKAYFWMVKVWFQNNHASDWSEINKFHTGIIHQSDWKANWVEATRETNSAPLFRKNFILNNKVRSAVAHVTGLGYYEFYLNGNKVGDQVLDPAITTYNKRVLYSSFDVTNFLNEGANAAGMMLGNGAFRVKKEEDRFSPFSRKYNNYDLGSLKGLVQIEITFDDGRLKTIVTDNTWKFSSGPITFNHIYGGEDYDARKEKNGWASPDYDDSEWPKVQIAEGPGGKLSAQLMPAMRVTETIAPVKQTNPEPGTYLYDLAQNLAGWWRITVRGEAGSEIHVRGAETLNDSLFPKPLAPGDRLSAKHQYHAKVWTTYTLKGDGTEVYEPRFFYTGFRYAEVKIDSPEKIESINLEGRVVHSDLHYNGSFSSSNPLLNNIHKAAVWSQRGNLHGYPTDCPHREKGAYTGDGQVIAETSMHDFQMAAFYNK